MTQRTQIHKYYYLQCNKCGIIDKKYFHLKKCKCGGAYQDVDFLILENHTTDVILNWLGVKRTDECDTSIYTSLDRQRELIYPKLFSLNIGFVMGIFNDTNQAWCRIYQISKPNNKEYYSVTIGDLSSAFALAVVKLINTLFVNGDKNEK